MSQQFPNQPASLFIFRSRQRGICQQKFFRGPNASLFRRGYKVLGATGREIKTHRESIGQSFKGVVVINRIMIISIRSIGSPQKMGLIGIKPYRTVIPSHHLKGGRIWKISLICFRGGSAYLTIK